MRAFFASGVRASNFISPGLLTVASPWLILDPIEQQPHGATMDAAATFADTGRALGYKNEAPNDQPTECEANAEAAHRHAEALVLNDMDMFTDFIACHGKRHVDSDRIIRVPQLSEFRVRDAGLEQVVHLLLNGDAGDVLLARDELKRRYLAENKRFIQKTADRWSAS